MQDRLYRKGFVFGIVWMLVIVAFATVSIKVSAEEPEGENGWWVEGTGTYFEITNSSYLNITLTSSEVVDVFLESVPNVVSCHIESNCSAVSTLITLSGFEPNGMYYRYQDGYLMANFTTDAEGEYTYTQDVSEPHHVFIQEETSTLYIDSDYTFTSDIYEAIVVTADNIVIDGNGYTLQGHGSYPAPYYGFYLYGRSGVTIKNVIVKGWREGIYLDHSSNNCISGNNIIANGWYGGIRLTYYSSNNSISGNNIIANDWYGIRLTYYSSNNSISGNNITNNDQEGISLAHYSSNNSISGNNITANGRYGILLGYHSSNYNSISGNNIINNWYGIYLGSSSNNSISGNIISNNDRYGLTISDSSGTNISDNIFLNNGLSIYQSYQNIVSNNTVDNRPLVYLEGKSDEIIDDGAGQIILVSCDNITIQNQQLSNTEVQLGDSKNCVVSDNTISNNRNGIYIWSSNNNTISGNNITNNKYSGISLISYSKYNSISGNNITANGCGISLGSSNNNISGNNITNNGGGISGARSSNNNISGNNITNNDQYGIYLESSSNYNSISGNNITANGRDGIWINWYSKYNSIFGNTIAANGYFGIVLFDFCTNNVVYHNNLIDNGHDPQAYTHWGNWHHPDLLEGNYWSDYTGVDDGSGTGKHAIAGDGIGDTNIPWPRPEWEESDYYPLMYPYRLTSVRTDVEVYAGSNVTMHFSNVTSPGDTSVDLVQGSPPANFRLFPSQTYFVITTTAEYSGIINISISYNDSGLPPEKEEKFKLKYWNETIGDWIDITTWVDTVNNIIYGETTRLSIFAIMLKLNDPPAITSLTAPIDPVEVGTLVQLTGNFTDPDSLDTHTATFYWGDTTYTEYDLVMGDRIVNGSHEYTEAGVYTINLTVMDDDGESDSLEFQYIVVYDPDGGFVTGGGWINSPEGAYCPDPSLTGKANFGFVSKYKRGQQTPIGNTEFNFKVANMNFHSSEYEWLVIAGPKAMYRGTGTINGDGNYGFMLTAIDEELTPSTDVDMFRINIWDKDDDDNIIYDNNLGDPDDGDPTTILGGGQIKIHGN